jgi:pimeloyl-ACP methyl ester carboxylesterase
MRFSSRSELLYTRDVAIVRDNIGPLNIYLRDKALIGPTCPDVVMIQGFGTGPRSMRPVADHLQQFDLRAAVAPIGGLLGHLQTRSVSRAAKRLNAYLRDLPPDCRPWLVAHSLGGIIARMAVQDGEAKHHISGLITLGTPHQGCPAAAAGLMLGLGLISMAPWSITPLSPTIRNLNRTPWPRSVPLIAIASHSDVLCRPKHSHIPFADERVVRNLVLGDVGHTQMLRSQTVLQTITGLIDQQEAA